MQEKQIDRVNIQDTSEPPVGFKYDPDLLADYDEQVEFYKEHLAYQEKAVPNVESLPVLDIKPTFNPTGAPVNEIYARNRVPHVLRNQFVARATHAELSGSTEPVEMWRIVDRKALLNGTAITSSTILLDNHLGDVEGFNTRLHFASHHDQRLEVEGRKTPFISFSTDPEYLARTMIQRYGFGIKDGRDSVVIRVLVDPDRVMTSGRKKDEETLLLGGLAPEEYVAAYDIHDFVGAMTGETIAA